jgi:NAD(P)-dependent dehydrogenase (short-subunit alcohol dehydrogenase family)
MATILITGCNSGFGMAGALAFARNGDHVYATMRHPDKAGPLRQAAAREQLNLHIKSLDVTLAATFGDLIQQIIDETGRIDVLVNNAGILRSGAFEDLSEQAIREVMETNYFGPLLLTRKVLPQMRKQRGGYIIMISSLSGIAGLAGDVSYTGSKFALEGATEALRHEIDRWGIKVALVQAALYATNIFAPDLSSGSSLPKDYPLDSPYRSLIKTKLAGLRDKLPDGLDPRVVGKLLVTIANSDGTQLRWPADDLSTMVSGTIFGQSDADRDAFLRNAAGTDWWSEGKDAPDS